MSNQELSSISPSPSKVEESRLARRTSSGRKKLHRKSLSLSPRSRSSSRSLVLPPVGIQAPKISQTSSHEVHKTHSSHNFTNVSRSKARDRMMHKVSVITNSRSMCIVDDNDLLSDCVIKMTASNSSIALVMSSNSQRETLKMVTRSSVVNKVFSENSLDVSEFRVWQVAKSHAPLISSDATLAECAKRMKHTLSSSLFVVDNENEGSIVGIVDTDDLFQYAFATSSASIQKSITSVDLHMERLHEETSGLRHLALSIVDHLITSFFILLLMIADLTFAVYAIARDEDIHDDSKGGDLQWMHITTLTILGIFVAEIMLRMYAYREEFLNLLDVSDAFVVIVAFVFGWFDTGEFTGLVVILRLLRFMRAVRVVVLCRKRYELWSLSARKLVSQNKARIRVGNFDLDLAYIEPDIIAMSLPSMGASKMFRNPIDEVAHFLDLKHGKSYHVYNLCSERDYPTHFFHDRVTRVPFDDHGPPTLEQLITFTNTAAGYLRQTKDGVVCVHCKGGKGRTGTMIAALLLKRGICKKPENALFYFARKRTSADESTRKSIRPDDSIGPVSPREEENEVEESVIEAKSSSDCEKKKTTKKRRRTKSLVRVSGPSQIRYVHYFFELLDSARRENVELVSVEKTSSVGPRKQSLRLMQNEESVKLEYPRIKRKLLRVQFVPAPKLSTSCTLKVNTFRKNMISPILDHVNVASVDSSSGIFEFDSIVCDDVKFQLVYDQLKDFAGVIDILDLGLSNLTKKVADKELCFWHLHTSMLREKENEHGVTIVELKKSEVDGAVKDKKCNVFENNLRVLIHFGRCEDADGNGKENDVFSSKEDDEK